MKSGKKECGIKPIYYLFLIANFDVIEGCDYDELIEMEIIKYEVVVDLISNGRKEKKHSNPLAIRTKAAKIYLIFFFTKL